MKIKIVSKDTRLRIWLPLSLIKSRLIIGIIRRSVVKKQARHAEDKAAGTIDSDDILDATEATAKDTSQNAADISADNGASAEKPGGNKAGKAVVKNAFGKLNAEMLLNPNLMREIYKILRKHKGLRLVDICDSNGDIVKIVI